MDPGSVIALTEALDDPVADVRVEAIHALACDRCKGGGSCRPDAAILPTAMTLLRDDPSPAVRAMAAELVGA